ncbi:MAG: hypothetical protein Q9169_005569 [Polycauliona sp. 2 TL-2023]
MSSLGFSTSFYLDGNGEDKSPTDSTVPKDLQEHASCNWKSFCRWYDAKYQKSGLVNSKQARFEMQRILSSKGRRDQISRAEFCDLTVTILGAWSAKPLIVGTKDYDFARFRLLRDIMYETLVASTRPLRETVELCRLHQILPNNPSLAALSFKKKEINTAYRWIYRTDDRRLARHSAPGQIITYPILARDGTTTLSASQSYDNRHLYERIPTSSSSLLITPFSPLSINESNAPNEHYHPYLRIQNMNTPSIPGTSRKPPLALLTEDPSFATPDEVPIFPDSNGDPPPFFETSADNEMTLDELIGEAKDQSSIMGYMEALSRGLLRRSRVQWAPDQPPDMLLQAPGPVPIASEQAAADVMSLAFRQGPLTLEQAAEDMLPPTPRPIPSMSRQVPEDAMSQIPQVQMLGGFPSIASPDDEPFEHFRYLDQP